MGCQCSAESTTVDRPADELSMGSFSMIYTQEKAAKAKPRKRVGSTATAPRGPRGLSIAWLTSQPEEQQHQSMLADDLAFSALVVHSVNEERRRSTIAELLSPTEQGGMTVSLMSLGRANSFDEFCAEEITSNPFSPMTTSGRSSRRLSSQRPSRQSMAVLSPLLPSLNVQSMPNDDFDDCSPELDLPSFSPTRYEEHDDVESDRVVEDCEVNPAKAALDRLVQLDETLQAFNSTLRRRSATEDPNNKLLQLKVSSLRVKISKITSFVGVCPDCLGAYSTSLYTSCNTASFTTCTICKRTVAERKDEEPDLARSHRLKKQKVASGW